MQSLSLQCFSNFQQLLNQEAGIILSHESRSIFEGKIRGRTVQLGVESYENYYKIITENRDELYHFFTLATNNLTRFFRNIPHFEALEKYVVPEIITSGKEKIRFWSAGCSTGEEPYTAAMVLNDCLPADVDFMIFATDISEKCLKIAEEGLYGSKDIQNVPDHLLNKYFREEGDSYRIVPEIRSRVTFEHHNLKHIDTLSKTNFDIVFCRNVMIYFDTMMKENLVKSIWNLMSSDSYLFIGHSESLFGMNTQFNYINTKYTGLYRKKL